MPLPGRKEGRKEGKMPYSEKKLKDKVFLGTPISKALHREFTRLCEASGRSKAKELEIAVTERVAKLSRQEKAGTIRGMR